MQHTVIPSWYQREGYIKAMANLIEKELKSFDCPEKVPLHFIFKCQKCGSYTSLLYRCCSSTSDVDSLIYTFNMSDTSGWDNRMMRLRVNYPA